MHLEHSFRGFRGCGKRSEFDFGEEWSFAGSDKKQGVEWTWIE
jgi:hypothetical protein